MRCRKKIDLRASPWVQMGTSPGIGNPGRHRGGGKHKLAVAAAHLSATSPAMAPARGQCHFRPRLLHSARRSPVAWIAGKRVEKRVTRAAACDSNAKAV